MKAKLVKRINFALMVLIFLIEILIIVACLYSFFLIKVGDEVNITVNIILTSVWLLKSLVSLFILLYYGVHSLFFKIISKLIKYIIFQSICGLIQLVLLISDILITPIDFQNPQIIQLVLNISSLTIVGIYSFNIIFSIVYKNILDKQVATSPLNNISKVLTVEEYKKLMFHSKSISIASEDTLDYNERFLSGKSLTN